MVVREFDFQTEVEIERIKRPKRMFMNFVCGEGMKIFLMFL
jgi:hypothetical protein